MKAEEDLVNHFRDAFFLGHNQQYQHASNDILAIF